MISIEEVKKSFEEIDKLDDVFYKVLLEDTTNFTKETKSKYRVDKLLGYDLWAIEEDYYY